VKLLKSLIKRFLLSRNAVISRPPGQFEICELRLATLRRIGLRVTTAVDAGAADGEWAESFLRVFPEATVLCVEPRASCQGHLNALARRTQRLKVVPCLLGSTTGSCEFFEHGNQSSRLKNASGECFGEMVQYPLRRLDDVIMADGMSWPDFLKLDLQGAELDCLAGAPLALEHAQAVLLEVSFIPLYAEMPLCADVVAFMNDKGFRLYDIVGLLRRPLDTALAQGDFLFIRTTSAVAANPRWDEVAAWS
jgi:FkbM family methyltransferase